jgi:hypothetical protein
MQPHQKRRPYKKSWNGLSVRVVIELGMIETGENVERPSKRRKTDHEAPDMDGDDVEYNEFGGVVSFVENLESNLRDQYVFPVNYLFVLKRPTDLKICSA